MLKRLLALCGGLLPLAVLAGTEGAEQVGALKVASSYYWQASPVGNTAQLVTLLCRSCASPVRRDSARVPLLSVLRDTLGDGRPDTARLTYVWLLGFEKPNLGRRALSGVPFFYWRVGEGTAKSSARDTVPLLDLTSLEHPVMTSLGSELMQRLMFDGLITPVRASSRAYRTNALDHERLHLEEAISYLREAPAAEDTSGLTKVQIETLIARLELRKTLLGGLVGERRAADLGQESLFNYERTRARNWELLRQWAEKTGLCFETLNLAGTKGQYGIVWFVPQASEKPAGTELGPLWKLLNIKNPWDDMRFRNWTGITQKRWVDESGGLSLTPRGNAREVTAFPLSVYSLDYPKQPLLLVDFRNMLHVRRHEMTQRTITELTSGVIGISHFTNWYYFAGAALYDFVASRHGAAMNQSQRLDSYSQFRVRLALDAELDAGLRNEMRHRVDSLAVNPLELSPARELQTAAMRYDELQKQANEGGKLEARLDKNRRKELALAAETHKERLRDGVLHAISLGAYTHRVEPSSENLGKLSNYRRFQYQLELLDSLTRAGTPPEIAYDADRIRAVVAEVSSLLPKTDSAPLRAHAGTTLARLRDISRDPSLQADCSAAVAVLERPAIDRGQGLPTPGVALKPSVVDGAIGKSAFRAGTGPLE